MRDFEEAIKYRESRNYYAALDFLRAHTTIRNDDDRIDEKKGDGRAGGGRGFTKKGDRKREHRLDIDIHGEPYDRGLRRS